jgi:hypothetical protein
MRDKPVCQQPRERAHEFPFLRLGHRAGVPRAQPKRTILDLHTLRAALPTSSACACVRRANAGAAYASRRQTHTATTQINVVNSTVGQLALGDIHNVTMTAILDAVDRAIDTVDATPEAKQEARTVVQRMRDAAGSVVSSTRLVS